MTGLLHVDCFHGCLRPEKPSAASAAGHDPMKARSINPPQARRIGTPAPGGLTHLNGRRRDCTYEALPRQAELQPFLYDDRLSDRWRCRQPHAAGWAIRAGRHPAHGGRAGRRGLTSSQTTRRRSSPTSVGTGTATDTGWLMPPTKAKRAVTRRRVHSGCVHRRGPLSKPIRQLIEPSCTVAGRSL
jgi:hypothetical protein